MTARVVALAAGGNVLVDELVEIDVPAVLGEHLEPQERRPRQQADQQ